MRSEAKNYRGSSNLFNGGRVDVVRVQLVHEALAPFVEEQAHRCRIDRSRLPDLPIGTASAEHAEDT